LLTLLNIVILGARRWADWASLSGNGMLHVARQMKNLQPTADDPTVPVAHVNAFAEEMTKAGANWQMVSYGATKHGFTYPSAATRDRVDRIQQAHG
jgi:hypothetical protein